MNEIRRNIWNRILLSLGLLLIQQTNGQVLVDDECVVTVLNQSVVPDNTGAYSLPNIPVGFENINASAVCERNGRTVVAQSDYFTVSTNEEVEVGTFYEVEEEIKPVRLSLLSESTQLAVGDRQYMTVLLELPSSNIQEASLRKDGTSYLSSNPNVLSVTADGVVEALQPGRVMLSVSNNGVSATQLFVVSSESGDQDGDGIPDDVEIQLGLNPNAAFDAQLDVDKDGLTAVAEYQAGTQIFIADSDGDTLSDGEELLEYNTQALLFDSDGDFLSDGLEISLGSDPNDSDSVSYSEAITDISATPSEITFHIRTADDENTETLVISALLTDGTSIDITSFDQTNFSTNDQLVAIPSSPKGVINITGDGTTLVTVESFGFSVEIPVTVTSDVHPDFIVIDANRGGLVETFGVGNTLYLRGVNQENGATNPMIYDGRGYYRTTANLVSGETQRFKIANYEWTTVIGGNQENTETNIVEANPLEVFESNSNTESGFLTFTPSTSDSYRFELNASDISQLMLSVYPDHPFGGQDMYLRGELTNWDAVPENIMRYEGLGVFTLDARASAPEGYEFKMANPDWSISWAQEFGSSLFNPIVDAVPSRVYTRWGEEDLSPSLYFVPENTDTDYQVIFDMSDLQDPFVVINDLGRENSIFTDRIYLRGSFDPLQPWAVRDDLEFTALENGNYRLDAVLEPGEYRFKIADAEWGLIDFGAGTESVASVDPREIANRYIAMGQTFMLMRRELFSELGLVRASNVNIRIVIETAGTYRFDLTTGYSPRKANEVRALGQATELWGMSSSPHFLTLTVNPLEEAVP